MGEVTVSAGIDPSIKPEERQAATSKWFTLKEGFGKFGTRYHLGSSKEDTLKNLGQPKKKVSPDNWEYSTICTCEIPEFFNLFFRDGRLVKIILPLPQDENAIHVPSDDEQNKA